MKNEKKNDAKPHLKSARFLWRLLAFGYAPYKTENNSALFDPFYVCVLEVAEVDAVVNCNINENKKEKRNKKKKSIVWFHDLFVLSAVCLCVCVSLDSTLLMQLK